MHSIQKPHYNNPNVKKKKEKKKIIIIKDKKKKHKNKNKTEASLDSLFFWLGLDPFLRELSRNGLKILTALIGGNSLKGPEPQL